MGESFCSFCETLILLSVCGGCDEDDAFAELFPLVPNENTLWISILIFGVSSGISTGFLPESNTSTSALSWAVVFDGLDAIRAGALAHTWFGALDGAGAAGVDSVDGKGGQSVGSTGTSLNKTETEKNHFQNYKN